MNAVSSLLVMMGMHLEAYTGESFGETLLHEEQAVQAACRDVLGALRLTKAMVGA